VTPRPAPDPAADGALLAGIDAVFDHAAHAARRIRDLLPLYGDLLGGRFQLAQPGPRAWGVAGHTLEDVLAGRGPGGDGRPSP
jgi:hypothetical protein